MTPTPSDFLNYFSLFSFLLKDGLTALTLIFSFLATRRRCFFVVLPRDGNGGRVRCALLRSKWIMNAVPVKREGEQLFYVERSCHISVVPSLSVWFNHCFCCILTVRQPGPALRCGSTCRLEFPHFPDFCCTRFALVSARCVFVASGETYL